MAITPMKSVTIVGHERIRAEMVTTLQELGLIHLTDLAGGGAAADRAGAMPEGERGELPTGRAEAEARLAEVDRRLADASYCLGYISRFSPIQKGLVESFLGPRTPVDRATWDRAASFDLRTLVERCRQDEARLSEIRSRQAELSARLDDLAPLAELGLDLGDLQGSERVAVVLGRASEASYERLSRALTQSGAILHLERQGQARQQVYFYVFHLRDDPQAVEAQRAAGVEPMAMPPARGRADLASAGLRGELEGLESEARRIVESGKGLAAQRTLLYAIYDRLLLSRQQYEAQVLLGETERTFVLQGWCPALAVARVQRAMEECGPSAAILVRDPLPNENPPVLMDNGPWARPFEIVVNIFGWPSYREVDPTPVLAPFFAVFFAVALTDAAYGILIAAYCFMMMRQKRTPKTAHKFLRLMAYGGLVTVVIGALTGGWFANLLDYLPPYLGFVKDAKNAIIVFDPIAEPMKLMVVSLVLGILHLMSGLAIKMWRNVRGGHLLDGLMDQGLWLLLLPSLAIFGASGAAGLPAEVGTAAKYLALGSAAGLVLTQGRASRNIVKRLGGGLYSLYGLIGYLSDTLSYSRLLALGLATGSLGMAINQIAMTLWATPIVGLPLALLVLALGHGISLLINVFGAFIHSLRLQFVEFFSKFFEGGGRAFRPFAARPRYTEVARD